jgi:hypothetical protein
MSNVSYLVLPRLYSYKINLGRSVVLTEFEEAKVEEILSVVYWVPLLVLSAVPASSIVTQPDIISLSRERECKRIFCIQNPSFSTR